MYSIDIEMIVPFYYLPCSYICICKHHIY